MAKTLQRPLPTSSVANLLDVRIGAQVVGRPITREHRSTSPVAVQTPAIAQSASGLTGSNPIEPTGEVPDIPRQFTLTATTDRTLRRVVEIFTDATGLELRHSELLRAILHATAAALPALHEEARRIGTLHRPKNERGREAQRETVERRVGAAFAAAMRRAPIDG